MAGVLLVKGAKMMAKKLGKQKAVANKRHARQIRKGRSNPIHRETIDKVEAWENRFKRNQRVHNMKQQRGG